MTSGNNRGRATGPSFRIATRFIACALLILLAGTESRAQGSSECLRPVRDIYRRLSEYPTGERAYHLAYRVRTIMADSSRWKNSTSRIDLLMNGESVRYISPEMEIYRADGWEQAVRAVDPARGTNLAQHALTQNDAYDAEDAFSPDGKWIVFTSNRTGDLELYVMRPDGSGVVQLTHAKGYDGGPFFSPGGKQLVYRSDRAGNDLLQIFGGENVYFELTRRSPR